MGKKKNYLSKKQQFEITKIKNVSSIEFFQLLPARHTQKKKQRKRKTIKIKDVCLEFKKKLILSYSKS